MERLRNEEGPQSVEEKEHYFMEQVGMGEQLASKGMSFPSPLSLPFPTRVMQVLNTILKPRLPSSAPSGYIPRLLNLS